MNPFQQMTDLDKEGVAYTINVIMSSGDRWFDVTVLPRQDIEPKWLNIQKGNHVLSLRVVEIIAIEIEDH